ncbi:MAG: Na+/solute symporter [Clostridiales bacterium 38_11]|nr:MAG: Na+/solute symporter [Clostridiales bacterium 38_11]HBH13184.1 sodium:solute symporter [Clostridiales bacterium]
MENGAYLISTVLTLMVVSYVGINSSKKIKSAKDFSIGGRNFSSSKVAASIIGTLVGGASTIGTAQAAFVSGANGMWFTLGASLGCLFLGLFLARPLREANIYTIPEYMIKYYGNTARTASSIISSIAIFVHITGQVLAAVAIFTTLFLIGETVAVFITVLLIISYIFFGGFLGSSLVGSIKTVLLYLTLSISTFIVLKGFNGFGGLGVAFPRDPWFNLFSEGISTALAQGFALVIGVCSTQTYLQAIFSGRTAQESRRGAFLSALLIPPIGIMSTLIGLFMRANYPEIISKQALPLFVINYLNPAIGGVVIGTLIISVVATGAGLTLGISTMLSRDIYKTLINKNATDKQELFSLRISVLGVLLLTTLLVLFNLDSLILQWAFLSMTLRGTVVFMPLITILVLKDKTPRKAGLISMIVAPVVTILLSVLKLTAIDPLYLGMGASTLIITGYYFINKK